MFFLVLPTSCVEFLLLLCIPSSSLHSTPLHSTPLHSTPLHSTPLHSTHNSTSQLTPTHLTQTRAPEALGFRRAINRRRDFYADIAHNTVPQFHVREPGRSAEGGTTAVAKEARRHEGETKDIQMTWVKWESNVVFTRVVQRAQRLRSGGVFRTNHEPRTASLQFEGPQIDSVVPVLEAAPSIGRLMFKMWQFLRADGGNPPLN